MNSHSERDDKQQPHPSPTPAAAVQDTTHAKAGKPKTHKKLSQPQKLLRSFKKHWRKDPIAVLALTTAIFLTFFAGEQWRAVVTATNISERAWLTVPVASFKDMFNEGAPVSANVTIQNTGKSPAAGITISANIAVYQTAIPATSRLVDMPIQVNSHPSSAVLGPNASHQANVPSSRVAAKGDEDLIKSEKLFWYAYGRITYRDIFGDEHHTWYCFVADAANPRDEAEPRVCPMWNDVD